MFYYEDLLGVPYKPRGRSVLEGFDCYGLVIECSKRAGTPIKDLAYTENFIDNETAEKNYIQNLNLEKIDKPEIGAIIECSYGGALHCGYIVDSNLNVLHTTQKGIRLTNINGLKAIAYYKIRNSENER